MDYIQHKSAKNELFRSKWVEEQIFLLSSHKDNPSVLDVGARLSPFKPKLIECGFSYFSHDFNSYNPVDTMSPGLQNASWDYAEHDYTCDVLEIPTEKSFDLILCTEVLEHVPDPVSTLRKIRELCNSNGFAILTFPLISLMHQAPYWFSSGLSPFWVEHWAREHQFELIKLEISGDYIDLMITENARLLQLIFKVRGIGKIANILSLLRPFLPQSVLQSGGGSVLVVLKRIA